MYRIGWSTLNNGRRVTREVVPASAISTRRELLQLSDKGFPVNDINAKSIISYFDQFLTINEVERVNAVERLGHVGGKFISPLHESDFEVVTLDQGEKQTLESFKVKGTCEGWINSVFNPVKDNPVAVFIIASSFASVILRDLRLPPFIVDLSGSTSIGKSTISKIAGSVWGRVEDDDSGKVGIVSTWDTTPIGVERRAAFLNSFPIILDDTRNAKDYILKNIVYQFSSGRNKTRATVVGRQKDLTWGNIMISNGEVPLNDYAHDKGGVSARNISFTDRPIDNGNYILYNAIYEGMHKYHGSIGKKFIDVWTENKEKLIDEFATCKNYFNKKAGNNEVLTRLSNSFAVVYFTCKILKEYLSMEIDLIEIEKLMDTLKENENLDKPIQLLEEVLTHIDSLGDRSLHDEVRWIYKEDKNQLYVMPKFVNDLLGVESNQIRKEWLNRGITLEGMNRGKKTDTQVVREGRKTRRAIAFNMEVINELGYDFRQLTDFEPLEDDFLK